MYLKLFNMITILYSIIKIEHCFSSLCILSTVDGVPHMVSPMGWFMYQKVVACSSSHAGYALHIVSVLKMDINFIHYVANIEFTKQVIIHEMLWGRTYCIFYCIFPLSNCTCSCRYCVWIYYNGINHLQKKHISMVTNANLSFFLVVLFQRWIFDRHSEYCVVTFAVLYTISCIYNWYVPNIPCLSHLFGWQRQYRKAISW